MHQKLDECFSNITCYTPLQVTECPPVLLVDGYNVLHMYTDFMRVSQPDHPVVTETALEAQREFLEEALSTYSQRRGIKVVVVYDALNAVSDSVYIHIRTSTRSVLLARISSLE